MSKTCDFPAAEHIDQKDKAALQAAWKKLVLLATGEKTADLINVAREIADAYRHIFGEEIDIKLDEKSIHEKLTAAVNEAFQYEVFKDTCPKCKTKGKLVVYKATLSANGKVIRPETPLTPEGFETDPKGKYADLKDHSTEDEKVQCLACKAKFDLTDLAID